MVKLSLIEGYHVLILQALVSALIRVYTYIKYESKRDSRNINFLLY